MLRINFAGVLIGFAMLTRVVLGQDVNQKGSPGSTHASALPEAYYDIGGYHRQVSTKSAAGQTWFNRGLAMCFGFNHEEAVRCFENAISSDPGLAMGYWGMAYAWGPNINNTEIESHQIAKAHLAVHLAEIHSKSCTQWEKRLITALKKRYATPVPEERAELNQAYAEAMREANTWQLNDPLFQGLLAEALMILSPWKYKDADGLVLKQYPEIISTLENGLKNAPDDPFLCHLYIHAMELTPHWQRAKPSADRLRKAMPGIGHLVHMPSHIDVIGGEYESVIVTNEKAIRADHEFLEKEGANNFYTLYRIHNYHFLVYGAMFDGQYQKAVTASRDLVKQIPVDMLKSMPDFLDAFVPTCYHVWVRFGKWETILAEAAPAEYLPFSNCIHHYARAIAFASTNRIQQAEAELQAFLKFRKQVPETSILFNNSCHSLLDIAVQMMIGEIEYRKGRAEKGFEHLRRAVQLRDALNYDEPWGWMQPPRHALGALLLEAGRIVEAERVFKRDLAIHPKNLWSLHGLAECEKKLGQTARAKVTHQHFLKAATRADMKIDRSCFCRLD